jgi:hypothetical protein
MKDVSPQALLSWDVRVTGGERGRIESVIGRALILVSFHPNFSSIIPQKLDFSIDKKN